MNPDNNNFLGASLAVRGTNNIYTCAPRAKSEGYESGSNLGQCFKGSGSNPKLKQFYDMPPNDRIAKWAFLRLMGHSFNVTEEGDLIFGTPAAEASRKK